MKKNDYININYKKESKFNKMDIFEIDILGREVKFIEKEKSEAQLIPIKRRRGPRAAQHPSTFPEDGLSLWLKADAGVTISQTPYITQVILTGFTGIYSGANGTYNGSSEDQEFYHTSGLFYISGNTLLDASNDIPIATNSNNYQGAWTPTTYLSTITFTNAGTTSVNGIYTRTDSQFDIEYLPFLKSGGNISWDEELVAWIANNGIIGNDLYRNYSFTFDEDWSTENGAGPQPDATYSNSSRSVGSPTSTITSIPNPVDSWADQSGNSRVFYTSNSRASSVVISEKNFISLPTNTDLYSNTPIWPDSQIIGTIFCVARFASSSAGSTAYLFRHEGVEGDFIFSRGFNNTNAFYITSDGIDNVSSLTNANNNTNYLLGATFNESSVATLYLNGASTGSGVITSSNGLYNLYIGGLGEPSNIAEMIVYTRVLTDAERLQVETYLNQKYQIY